MPVLERCPSYRESSKGSKERQGPALGVRLIEVSVKRESTVQVNDYTIKNRNRNSQAMFISSVQTVW